MRVRPGTVADVPELERIWVEAGRAAWAHILDVETLAAPEALRRTFGDPDTFVLVVDDGNAVIGFTEACPDEQGEAVVRAFYTHPSAWGRGAGRVLMDALVVAEAPHPGKEEAALGSSSL